MFRIAIAALLLTGCASHRSESPESRYDAAEALHKRGQLAESLKEADTGLRAEGSWRFRLLKADILLSMGDGKKAIETLQSNDGIPPTDELRARLAMHRGYAKFLLSEYEPAYASLEQARDLARPLHLPLLEAQIELRRGVLLIQRGRSDLAD